MLHTELLIGELRMRPAIVIAYNYVANTYYCNGPSEVIIIMTLWMCLLFCSIESKLVDNY